MLSLLPRRLSLLLCSLLLTTCASTPAPKPAPAPAPQDAPATPTAPVAPAPVVDVPLPVPPQRPVLPAHLANVDAEKRMTIHLLDVGQGSALLLEFPCAAVLVDTGGEQNDAYDSVPALKQQLDAFFLTRPDLNRTLALLVISHPHIDHMRGIPMLLASFNVKNVVDNGQPGDELVADPMEAMHQLVAKGAGHRTVAVEDLPPGGLTDAVIDPVACSQVDPKLVVLWGRLNGNPGWRTDGDRSPFLNANNHSVVMRVDFGETSILVTGDLETDAQRDLVKRYEGTRTLDVDIYLVGHHGSANGTTRELMEAVRPKMALMSMGPSERHRSWTAYQYGHPRESAVNTVSEGLMLGRPPLEVQVGRGMKKFGARNLDRALFATGWDGAVTVESDVQGHLAVDATGWHQAAAAH